MRILSSEPRVSFNISFSADSLIPAAAPRPLPECCCSPNSLPMNSCTGSGSSTRAKPMRFFNTFLNSCRVISPSAPHWSASWKSLSTGIPRLFRSEVRSLSLFCSSTGNPAISSRFSTARNLSSVMRCSSVLSINLNKFTRSIGKTST